MNPLKILEITLSLLEINFDNDGICAACKTLEKNQKPINTLVK